jgi:hypothetical protein
LGLEVLGARVTDHHGGDDFEDLIGFLIGDENGNALADDLGRGVAVHVLGASIPGRDDALEGLADDRVV